MEDFLSLGCGSMILIKTYISLLFHLCHKSHVAELVTAI